MKLSIPVDVEEFFLFNKIFVVIFLQVGSTIGANWLLSSTSFFVTEKLHAAVLSIRPMVMQLSHVALNLGEDCAREKPIRQWKPQPTLENSCKHNLE